MEAQLQRLTIGKLARAGGLAVDTVRYYERVGLLAKPARSASGYRQYPLEAVVRLQFIRQAKELGFTLAEIRELLALRLGPGNSCAEVRARVRAKIADIEHRLGRLEAIKRTLARLAASCPGRGPLAKCPILDAFEKGSPAGGAGGARARRDVLVAATAAAPFGATLPSWLSQKPRRKPR